MNGNCANRGVTFSHRLGRCKGCSTTSISFQFMEAARRHEEFSLVSQAANKRRSSRKLEKDEVFFYAAPDTAISELFTDGATKHRLDNGGLQVQAAEGNSKKNRFNFLAKFQKGMTGTRGSDRASPWRVSFHASLLSRRVLVRECIELGRRIRVCFSPSSGAVDEDDDLPYMQLDKVTRALTRDAFGPLYLVT